MRNYKLLAIAILLGVGLPALPTLAMSPSLLPVIGFDRNFTLIAIGNVLSWIILNC